MSWSIPIVIAYFRGDTTVHPQFAGIISLYLPWVVLGELYFGAQKALRRQEQLTYIRDLLTYAGVLFPDREISAMYDQMKAELAQAGKPIPDKTSGSLQWPVSMICHLRPETPISPKCRD